MRLIKKHVSWIVGGLVAGALLLTAACGYLVHRSRLTLQVLLSAPDSIPATEVFSHWLTLIPGQSMSGDYLQRYLDGLEYKKTVADPKAPGEYRRDGDRFAIFAKGFRYPDTDLPAQILRVSFKNNQISELENSSKQALPNWRLEPWRLARWAAAPAAERPRVRLSELPPYVPGAVVAVEDKRFYRHPGFDLVGIARAVWIDLRHKAMRQGASTISQQLSRSVFLDTRRTLRRKVLEAALTLYLEVRFTKPQLLEMYLNQVYWGQDSGQPLLGIEATSRAYFGKSARQLTVAESALLAGLLHSPNKLSPRTAAKAAIDRRRRVLLLMSDQGIIAPAARAAALKEPLRLTPSRVRRSDPTYFLETLRDDLAQRYSLDLLLSQGWRLFTTLDPILQRQATAAMKPSVGEGALVALDPTTGAVRAWVGGTNFATAPFDRARLAHRQPGSAFKPFVFLAALEAKAVTPVTLLEDKPLRLQGIEGEEWSPQNYDRKFRGPVAARDVLIQSLNVPTVALAKQIGWPAVAGTAKKAGILSPLREDLSSALGSSEVTVLELTSAYGTLAAGGRQAEPYFIEAIVSTDGAAVETHVERNAAVFDPGAVYILTQLLQAVLDEGTAKSARARGFMWPAAGKTGTSENFQDAWFVGYTPNLVCGVWVGFDQPKSMGRSAAGLALPIWVDFMTPAFKDRAPAAFQKPEGLIDKEIDPESGLLARSGCPKRSTITFLPGTEPTEHCPKHSGGIFGFFKRLTRGTTQ